MTITLIEKVHKNKTMNEIANTVIGISILCVIPIIWNIIPDEFEVGYEGIDFIHENSYFILITIMVFIIGVILKLNNSKKAFGNIRFYNETISGRKSRKDFNYKINDLEFIKYLFSNEPVDSFEKERHWITIKPKGEKEIYSEFLGNEIQIDLIKLMTNYKDKGYNIEIETIY